MKKWAKVLMIIGIIYIILILIFSSVLYFKVKQLGGMMLFQFILSTTLILVANLTWSNGTHQDSQALFINGATKHFA